MEYQGQDQINGEGQMIDYQDYNQQNQQQIEEYDFELDIPSKYEPNMLIDYMDNTVDHYLLYKKIEQEPQYYLNFGFDLKDYAAFLIKQTYMRTERKVIEEKIRKIKGEDQQKTANTNEEQS
ncbi:hypothetical protein ABPG72_021081 [Tetrahymena utriculariae]